MSLKILFINGKAYQSMDSGANSKNTSKVSSSKMTRFLMPNFKRSRYFAQFLFMLIGIIITLSAFFILQSFISGMTEDEKNRISQDFVEEVVQDFQGLAQPLHDISDLIALSGSSKVSDIRPILEQKISDTEPYVQIVWFYKDQERGWTFASIHNRDTGARHPFSMKPDEKVLKLLLDAQILQSESIKKVQGVSDLGPTEHRQSPKIESSPFYMARAIRAGREDQGILLVVVDMARFYRDAWIGLNRHVIDVNVSDIDGNVTLFNFERWPGRDTSGYISRNYEFPFSGRNLEVSGVFTQDQRVKFLTVFPYVAGLFGLFLVAVGAFYIRNHQKQSDVLEDLNEALASKNKALEKEMEAREHLAHAMQEAEHSSRAVIDAVSDVIVECSDDGEILFLNKAWRNLTGFQVEQTIGQKLEQLVHPNDHKQIEDEFKSFIDGELKELHYFTQVRHIDGGFKAVELHLKVVSSAKKDSSRIIGTISDIEERRKVERALSDAEKKYRDIVQRAAGGIFQLTAEGLYLSANPAMARILGYENTDEMLREIKNANEQLYVDHAARRSFYEALLNTPDVKSHEVQMRCKDGSLIWVNESVRAVKDDAGQLLFIEGSIQDITKRKESDLEIHEAKMNSDLANRAKSEFLSNMSHELRTPLNSIIGFSEMIKNEVFGPISQKEYWNYANDIHSSGQKLLRVINEILDISKIEAGERQLNEGVINIANTVDSALHLLETKIENSKMIITKALDGIPDVIGEELAFKQILINLISNAVKFTPEKGRITISGHVGREGRLHISITDTGVGLDEFEIKKALSPFGQVDSELSRSGSGTGLGLTLVDALVKLHGGEFELFSQKGIGTTATIIIPADRLVREKGGDGVAKQDRRVGENDRRDGIQDRREVSESEE